MKISWERVLRDKESLGPIPCLTSYAYSSARAFAEAGVPLLLVGDSASMVVHGHRSTAQISEETMIDHVRAVRRGAPESFVVGDMPMGTYEVSKSSAMKSVTTFLKLGGAFAVKLKYRVLI